jgi:phenylalanyl-tRNA synthetase beta chain
VIRSTLPNAGIENVVLKLAEPLLVSFVCVDVFTDHTGEKLPADRKSVAYRFHYRASESAGGTDEQGGGEVPVKRRLTLIPTLENPEPEAPAK